MSDRFSIDQLEADLGQAAALRVLANVGGQRRWIPTVAHAHDAKLVSEVGVDVVVWLAERFAGDRVEFPSQTARQVESRASLLRAAIIDAGLINPSRSANDLAKEFGVTFRRVEQIRQELRAGSTEPLPLFKDL